MPLLSSNPAPTPEELAAITAAFDAIVRRGPDEAPRTHSVSIWQEAARREGLHGERPWRPVGWERAARLGQR